MTDFIPAEKGVPIRQASTANLQLDSADRGYGLTTSGSSGSFFISRANNLLNGFFTRIAPTEVALDWRVPNIGPTESTSDASNNLVQIDISNGTIQTYQVILPTGQYTCADAINAWAYEVEQNLNALTPGHTVNVVNLANTAVAIDIDLSGTALEWRFSGGPTVNRLFGDLGFTTGSVAGPFQTVWTAQTQWAQFGLTKYKYLDFTSPELTNQQDVKDGSTSQYFVRDSIFRWYLGFTNDLPLPVDSLGYPIYPTYKQFYIRRNLPFPKQIKWESNIPVGQLSFEVWATRWIPPGGDSSQAQQLLNRNDYSWQMTLQASEV